MSKTEPLPLFYSLNRFIDHEACISAGSVEICRASFILDVLGEGANSVGKLTVEGKLDTCGSVSLSHSSLLQDVKDCRKHGLKEVVLSARHRRTIQALKGSRSAACRSGRRESKEDSVLQV